MRFGDGSSGSSDGPELQVGIDHRIVIWMCGVGDVGLIGRPRLIRLPMIGVIVMAGLIQAIVTKCHDGRFDVRLTRASESEREMRVVWRGRDETREQERLELQKHAEEAHWE